MSVTLKTLNSKSPLKYLSSRYQKRIADASVITDYKKGGKVFDIGDSDGHLVFLIWGEVLLEASDGKTALIKHTDKSSNYPLSKMKPHRFSAVAASSQACILWVDRKLLKECMAKQIIRNKYEKKERQLRPGFSDMNNRASTGSRLN